MLKTINLENKCGSCDHFRQIGDTAQGECLQNPYGETVVHDPKHPYWIVARSRSKCRLYNAKPQTNADRIRAMSDRRKEGGITMDVREKLIELLECTYGQAKDRDYDCYGECKTCQAENLIANGVGFLPKWIPVTERLPEVADSYIVVVKSKAAWEKDYTYDTDVATYNPYEGGYIDGCWNTYIDWDEGQDFLHVTHWMPLPEPPKDVDHGSV